MELKETISGMTSSDYKERFKAEYNQLKIRIDKLSKFIVQIEAADWVGRGAVQHDCPLSILQEQLYQMERYAHILEIRAVIEYINLHE